ncbi:hypothetical protein [uncultured Acinetobacter sp.]|nr:hypothetical protein [uncultured Acinetobacter sp.]
MTELSWSFKLVFGLMLLLLLALSIALWLNTPNLFEYFNQAFCAH